MNRLIIVEGLPCSGKSTVSQYIAGRINALYYDEGSENHPADYEFHAFIKNDEMRHFSDTEQKTIRQNAVIRNDGCIVQLSLFRGELLDKLLRYKIYDFLPWETEKPIMLDKWREFANTAAPDRIYVFNCVLLQNPMCETMMRFCFDMQTSFDYIKSICDIIRPFNPLIVYLNHADIRNTIEKTLSERGTDWLNSVIDYHCKGAYGRANNLSGFDGYISALEERRRRETEILRKLDVQCITIDNPRENPEKSYSLIIRKIQENAHNDFA